MRALPEFRLESYFTRWEFAARFNLAASDAESWTVAELIALAADDDRERWETLRLGYAETWGDALLRGSIAATYAALDAHDVLCFAGAQEAIACAVAALLSPGDHAVVVLPTYQSLESIAASAGTASAVVLRASEHWRLDVDELRAACTPRTRLLILGVPNNPTGAVPDRDTFDAVLQLAAERGAWVLCDEVHRGLERDGAPRLPQAADVYEKAVSIGALSKAYGLPGLRIGWVACRQHDAIERMNAVKHYLSICNASPSEILGRIAIRARDRILDRNRAITRDNIGRFTRFCADGGEEIEWEPPPAACVAYPRYTGADGVETFCRRLIEEHGILLLPASIFESPLAALPANHFRVGLGRRDFGAGLDAWRQCRAPR